MSKNLEEREGYKNRNLVGLPKKKCIIEIITNDADGEHIDICEWKPFKKKNYTLENMPGEGYLGTATIISKGGRGIGFHAWNQNNSEFVYYKIIK